jgi:hypothetical protein
MFLHPSNVLLTRETPTHGEHRMAEKTANPVLDKILVALDDLVKAKEETTVRRMEQEISLAIQHAEDEFARNFRLPGRASKREAP